jgi:hypothetical protein
MNSKTPMEVLIQQFLTEHYLKDICYDDLMNICVYSSFCFEEFSSFESWWYISNLGLKGFSPAELATQEYGLKQVSHYLISLAHQEGDWS